MLSNLINRPVLREVLLSAFISLVILTLIPFGSVTPFPFAFAAIAMFALAIISALLFGEPRQSRWVFSVALLLLVVLTGWTFVQTIELPSDWLANPAWNAARDLADVQYAAISVEPADTLASTLWVALPFVTFLTGLLLCDTDQRARKVLAGLGLSAGIIAVFGLLQFSLFPNILIVVDKHAYLDSLTAVFVNRNTAATFLGLGTLLMLTLVRDIFRTYSNYPPGEPGRNALLLRSWIYILLLCACFTALMLSRSRAGIFATFVAALIYFPWLVLNWRGSRRHLKPAPKWRSMLKFLSAIGFVVVLLAMFAGQAILRAQERRLEDDDRFCILPGILRAVSDHWLTGTGLEPSGPCFPPTAIRPAGFSGSSTAHTISIWKDFWASEYCSRSRRSLPSRSLPKFSGAGSPKGGASGIMFFLVWRGRFWSPFMQRSISRCRYRVSPCFIRPFSVRLSR